MVEDDTDTNGGDGSKQVIFGDIIHRVCVVSTVSNESPVVLWQYYCLWTVGMHHLDVISFVLPIYKLFPFLIIQLSHQIYISYRVTITSP